MVRMSITFPRVLHLGRDAAGLTDLIAASLRGRRRYLPRDRRDESRELARNRGGHFRLGLAACHQPAEARGQTELRLPRDGAHKRR